MIARGTCEASWVTSVAGMVGKARFPVAVAEVEVGTSGSVIGGRESAKASVATGKEGIRNEFNRWWT